mmetsp:Transcript_7747/g.23286  ORF Transcript_7747/g.23286 Transcript_7747/m.23286 type:complete len:107 (-) Transcript_7747:422-742(-)
MFASLARRLLQGAPRQAGRRGYAGHGDYAPVPKPDTSMDHVFGDSNYKVDFNFQPPSALRTFALTAVTLAVFGFPAWMMVYEESQMLDLKARIAEAKASKRASLEE